MNDRTTHAALTWLMEGPDDPLAVAREYWAAFGTDDTRLMRDLERLCHAHSTTFTGDPNGTIFAEGQRSVLLHIQQMLRLTPGDFPARARNEENDDAA